MTIRLSAFVPVLGLLVLASCSQPPPVTGCVDGEQNCPCKTTDNPFDKCEAGLSCTLGKCLNCRAGDLNCACLGNDTCANDTLACSGGVCLSAPPCTAGTRGCTCDATGACSDGSACDANKCVDPAGHTGKACFANRTCLTGNQCVDGLCQACDLGSVGCGCLPGDACESGLNCVGGFCAWGDGLPHEVPAKPVCYTPCKAGLLKADGTYVPCSAEGLMEGCISGLECIDGTCAPKVPHKFDTNLPPGSPCAVDGDCDANALCVGGTCQAFCFLSQGTCQTDVNCPAHQVCLSGKCYSNCKTDGDCGPAARCHQAACRLPCRNGKDASPCPEGKTCVTGDGQSGFCLPSDTPLASEPKTPVAGSYSVQAPNGQAGTELYSIHFTNTLVASSLVIVNLAPSRQTFTVRKVSHREFAADGSFTEITDNPLNWILMGEGTAANRVQEFNLDIEGTESATTPDGNRKTVTLQHANNATLARWEGKLEVSHPAFGARALDLDYRESPAGQWQGRMHYFSVFNTEGLSAWEALPPAQKLSQTELAKVKNAFIQQWARLKSGASSVDEFKAMVAATVSGAWNTPAMKQGPDCDGANEVCFPYDNPKGYVVYTSDSSIYDVPAGMTEFPISINIQQDAADTSGTKWAGKIATNATLHYAGDPEVNLAFDKKATECDENATCTVLCQVVSFASQINVGARYLPPVADEKTPPDCADGGSDFLLAKVPFLVKGFTKNTGLDPDDGTTRVRYDCRDKTLPAGSSSKTDASNALAATSNPIPDGRQRKRTLTLVDGALIDQTTLVILFRENVPSFLGVSGSDFSGLGFMLLQRVPVTLDADAYKGTPQTPRADPAKDLLQVGCSSALLTAAGLGATFPTTAADLRKLGVYVLGSAQGDPSAPATIPEPPAATVGPDFERVHYLCVDTGQIDGGWGAPQHPVPCPGGSRVVYFTTLNTTSEVGYGNDPCQQSYSDTYVGGGVIIDAPEGAGRVITAKGTCEAVLDKLVQDSAALVAKGQQPLVRRDPAWRCKTDAELAASGVALPAGGAASAYCDLIRTDLRKEKVFFQKPAAAGSPPPLVPLDSSVAGAFQYKTKFKSRSGKNIGFAPVQCGVGQEYCYDAEEIEGLRDRLDCLTKVYTEGYATLAAARTAEVDPNGDYHKGLAAMQRALKLAYSYESVANPFATSGFETHDGFERLYAELLVMLGDESYTSAFASRFDLAGSSMLSFQGTKFEGKAGMDLSGGAGYEMYVLYQAAQYYELALERFYRLAPLIWKAVDLGEVNGFVTAETVSSYFKALTRASTQKAASYNEIAKRYQSFNRPDLARQVVERGYSSAYLESIVISNMLAKVRVVAGAASKPEIRKNLEEAAGRYRSAMLSMRDLYESITDRVNFFGFPVEYVPSPSLNEFDVNIFEKQLTLAKERMQLAAEKEATALANNRAFDTDAVAFQNELANLQSSFDDQLAEICGNFKAADGKVYPATTTCAYLLPSGMPVSDPCGLVGNGAIYEALVEVDQARLEARKVIATQAQIKAQIQIEQKRVEDYCGAVRYTVQVAKEGQKEIRDLNDGIATSQLVQAETARIVDHIEKGADMAKCNVGVSTNCLGAFVGLGTMTAMWGVTDVIQAGLDAAIMGMQHRINELQDNLGNWETLQECEYAKIDSRATVQNLWLDMAMQDLEALQALQTIKLALAKVDSLRNQELSTLQSLEDATQMTINLEAARNDPNVRIYKNDDILAADRTFQAAVKEAYKATKVFEYFTSQTYAHAGDLFLVRMVQHGDLNLESYLFDLENAYLLFRESYGNPDVRVQVVSMRDDIFKIGKLDAATSQAYCESDRVQLFRKALQDVTLLDENGYIVASFTTSFKELSPLTRDHKVLYVEAELEGTDLGDSVARVYLRQRGTGAVKGVDEQKYFYTQPAKTAVINAITNGKREFDDSVYRSERLRDRPYVNTQWQLIINKKDELANKDINLGSLSDIRLYVYYTDYTAL